MKSKRVTVVISALACLASLACAPPARARDADKESVLRTCERLFGAPVDEKQNFFEVNQFYVLRVKFDEGGRLEQLAVEPKYFFEESRPEWEYPSDFRDLSQGEYESLLERLDGVRPKGALRKADAGGGVVTNMTSRHKAVYENAVLEWGEVVDLRRGEFAPLAIKWVRLNYQK